MSRNETDETSKPRDRDTLEDETPATIGNFLNVDPEDLEGIEEEDIEGFNAPDPTSTAAAEISLDEEETSYETGFLDTDLPGSGFPRTISVVDPSDVNEEILLDAEFGAEDDSLPSEAEASFETAPGEKGYVPSQDLEDHVDEDPDYFNPGDTVSDVRAPATYDNGDISSEPLGGSVAERPSGEDGYVPGEEDEKVEVDPDLEEAMYGDEDDTPLDEAIEDDEDDEQEEEQPSDEITRDDLITPAAEEPTESVDESLDAEGEGNGWQDSDPREQIGGQDLTDSEKDEAPDSVRKFFGGLWSTITAPFSHRLARKKTRDRKGSRVSRWRSVPVTLAFLATVGGGAHYAHTTTPEEHTRNVDNAAAYVMEDLGGNEVHEFFFGDDDEQPAAAGKDAGTKGDGFKESKYTGAESTPKKDAGVSPDSGSASGKVGGKRRDLGMDVAQPDTQKAAKPKPPKPDAKVPDQKAPDATIPDQKVKPDAAPKPDMKPPKPKPPKHKTGAKRPKPRGDAPPKPKTQAAPAPKLGGSEAKAFQWFNKACFESLTSKAGQAKYGGKSLNPKYNMKLPKGAKYDPKKSYCSAQNAANVAYFHWAKPTWRGGYSKDVNQYKTAAKGSRKNLCFNVGKVLREGRGKKVDPTKFKCGKVKKADLNLLRYLQDFETNTGETKYAKADNTADTFDYTQKDQCVSGTVDTEHTVVASNTTPIVDEPSVVVDSEQVDYTQTTNPETGVVSGTINDTEKAYAATTPVTDEPSVVVDYDQALDLDEAKTVTPRDQDDLDRRVYTASNTGGSVSGSVTTDDAPDNVYEPVDEPSVMVDWDAAMSSNDPEPEGSTSVPAPAFDEGAYKTASASLDGEVVYTNPDVALPELDEVLPDRRDPEQGSGNLALRLS